MQKLNNDLNLTKPNLALGKLDDLTKTASESEKKPCYPIKNIFN